MWIMWTTSEETSRKTLRHLLRKYWKYHREWDTRESLILFNTPPPFQTLSLSMSASALLFYVQLSLFTVIFYSKDWENQFHSFNGMVLHQQSDIMVTKNWKHADKVLRNFQLWKSRMRQILFSRPQRTRTFGTDNRCCKSAMVNLHDLKCSSGDCQSSAGTDVGSIPPNIR